MNKIIDADVIKSKLITYGFSSFRMKVTKLINECEELPTMQSNHICAYCGRYGKQNCEHLEKCKCFEGKRMIEVNE